MNGDTSNHGRQAASQILGLESDDDEYIDDEPAHTSDVLHQLLQEEEERQYAGEERTHQEEEEMCNLCCAALGLIADDMTDIEALLEPDEVFLKEMGAAESQYIQDTFSDFNLPPLNLPDVASRPLGMGNITSAMLDFSALVGMHHQHQTDYAARSVRTRDTPAHVDEGLSSGDEPDARTQKVKIKKQIVERLWEQRAKEQACTQTTGCDCAFRWVTTNTTGSTSGNNTEAGNSANAAAVASVAARRALLHHKEAFRKTDSLCLDDLIAARISQFRPLQQDDFVFVYTDFGVMVGQVVTIYAKTAGKNGKHASVVDAANVVAISNVAVQLFQELLGSQFTAIPHMMVAWQAKRFALLPSQALLSLLSSGSPAKTDNRALELQIEDLPCFRSLRQGEKKLSEAMKLLKGRKFQPEELDE
ncbi:hypothetical protein EWM64_g5889 [Hericium alpestre]|uniref:Uncharacterized protein n=1 Tax=Hericium alpestre TaxID=135208 RepID=A0A4Y9ZVP5_9AGAM|nr:hypothetical protein EWM64_g5889 [Hericium alpestre]